MSRFTCIDVHPHVASQLAAGDRGAQETVYRAYSSAVYTMARRILGDDGLAEEATQDTFVEVIRGAARLARAQALGPWIRTIAVNQCWARLRSPWHRRRERLEYDDRAADSGAERAIDIEQALGRLSPEARMVVWMHCIEGYTHEEIGRAVGRTPSFSKSQLARACRALSENAQPAPAQQPTGDTDDEPSQLAL